MFVDLSKLVPASYLPATAAFLLPALSGLGGWIVRKFFKVAAAGAMLGGASEKAVLLLIESQANLINDPTTKQRFESDVQRAQSIFRKYELFERQLTIVRPRMPRSMTENVDSVLRGVFDLIRSSRNDAGHPASGTPVDRDLVYSHLRLFTPYCRRIYDLIGWFAANRT